MDNTNRMLSYAEASQYLSSPVGTLQYWVHKKKIPFIRLGPRSVRFRESELQNWLKTNELTVDNVEGGQHDNG